MNRDKEISGWLFQLLSSGDLELPMNQSANIEGAKVWLKEIGSEEKILVRPPSKESTPSA